MSDNAHSDVLIDEIVSLTRNETYEQYLKHIRRIAVYNAEQGFIMELLISNMKLSAENIVNLYMEKWDIDFFPKPKAEFPHQ